MAMNFRWNFPLRHTKEKDGWVFNAFIRDLTELREAEKNLRVAHIQLLRKERLAAVGQVTATVAHELHNPMGTIVNSVYMLSEMLGASDLAVNKIVDRVNRNVQRCNTIIDDLLDFTSEHAMNPAPWELDAWLKRLLDEYEYEHQVKVEIVRKLSCGGRVLFDTVYFQSAVTNVLDNAIQAMGERPVDGGRIEVSTVIDNNRIGVVIGDNGPGIPEGERKKVFEPLYSTKNFGIGLGLPAVARIMKQHGGEVVLEENTNGGVRVSLWLDRAEPAVTNVLSDYHQDKKNLEVQ
jgi:signal transduction histidine kinase